jgi:hypothetical protein
VKRNRGKELTHTRFMVSMFCRVAAKWTSLFYSNRAVLEGKEGIKDSLSPSFQKVFATCIFFVTKCHLDITVDEEPIVLPISWRIYESKGCILCLNHI